jgi:hypothetical protein
MFQVQVEGIKVYDSGKPFYHVIIHFIYVKLQVLEFSKSRFVVFFL